MTEIGVLEFLDICFVDVKGIAKADIVNLCSGKIGKASLQTMHGDFHKLD